MAATCVWSALVLLVLVFLGCSCQTTNPSSNSSVTATNTTSTKVLSTTTTVTPTTTPAAPSPPSAPQLLSRTNDSLSVNWTGTASFYMVQHRVGDTLNDSLTNRINITTAIITGLIAGETYSIKVIAYNNATGGTGVPGPATNITTTPHPTGVPTAMRASTDNSTIATVSWSNPTNTEWENVTVSCQPSCTTQTVHKPTSTVDITGLTPGETYTFTTVVSSNGVKSSPSQTSAPLTMIPNPTGVPNATRASTDNSTIATVSWSDPNNTEWDDVTVSCQPSCTNQTVDKPTSTVNITGLTPGETYTFTTVVSSNGVESSPSQTSAPLTMKPSDPTSFQASANGENITLTWDYQAGHVTSGFSLQCSPSIDGCNSTWTTVGGENSTTITLVGATLGQTYNFTLRAESGLEASKEHSDGASVAIYLDAASPSNLHNIDENRDDVTLQWNAPLNTAVHFYRLYWNATNGAQSNYTDTKDSTTTTLTVSTLEPGFSYDFSVALLSDSGILSSPSDVISYTAYPSEVTGLTLKPPSHDTLTFTWNFTGRYENFSYSLSPDTSGSQVFLTNVSDVYTLKYSSLYVDKEYNFTVGTQVQDAANVTSYKFSEFVTASGRTDEFNPSKVVDLRKVKSTTDSITISWNPPDPTNGVVIGYVVQRYTEDESDCTQSVFFNCIDCLRKEYDYSTTVINLKSQCSQQDPDRSYDSTDILSYEFIDLKTFTEYRFKVFAINTKVPSVDEISLMTNESAPLKQKIDPSLSKSWIGDITENQITFTLTNDISEIFSEANGEITDYQIIVAVIGDNEPADLGSEVKTWSKAFKTGEAYAPWDRAPWTPASRKRAVSSGWKIIGNGDCDPETSGYCNGPLKPNTYYCVRMRGWTAGGFSDSNCLVDATTKPDVAMIVGIVLAVLACLFIIAAMLFVLKRKGIIFAGKGEKLPSGDETPPRGQSDVQLEPVMPPPQAVDQQDFIAHTDEMHRDQDFRFSQEYQKLRDMSAKHTHNAAVLGSNTSKNRWVDILPFDHSRVKLLPADEEEGSDYINANYMPGYSSKREYIATQGPLPGTIDHFWRMIWEQNVSMVVMLTQCIERGRRKCEPYWPENMEEAAIYGDLLVTKRSESILPEYTIRIFDIQMATRKRPCIMFHFTHWPDFGCPETCDSLLKFITDIRMHFTKETGRCGPIVVHCSAGVGRTGTYIAVDRLLQHIQDHDEIDIFNLVLEMRNYRCRMVQTEDQYIYIHDCLKEALLTGMSSRYTPKASHEEDPIYQNTQAMDPEMVLIDVHGKSGEDGAVKNTEL